MLFIFHAICYNYNGRHVQLNHDLCVCCDCVSMGDGTDLLSGLSPILFHSVIVYWLPIDKLHREHIGFKLVISVLPPWLSGILCPTWKSNTLIVFWHQSIKHLCSYWWPIFFNQTCSLRALGILALWYAFVFFGISVALMFANIVADSHSSLSSEIQSEINGVFNVITCRWRMAY